LIVQKTMIEGFIMKKNIFIIMALFAITGAISAMDEEKRPTTPENQGIGKECPPQTPKYKEAKKAARTARRKAGN